MSHLRATATALPRYIYDQTAVKQAVLEWLGPRAPRFERVLAAFDRGLVRTRGSVLPLDEVFAPRSFEEKNDCYIEAAIELGTRAVQGALTQAGLVPRDIDFFISTSCTGFMIPSVDALIAHRLAMKPTLARLPITQHGCAGGAVALRQAHDHLRAHPGHRVLVLAVEVPSVTFQPKDYTAENLVSATLFGDGAAAVVLEAGGSDTHSVTMPTILGCDSRMFPDSADLMGFRLRNSGLKIVLSKRVPHEIARHAPEAIASFLASYGTDLGSIDHFLLHPGGRKIIEGFESAFGLAEGGLAATRDVLARCGNLSSATVLFILDDYVRSGKGARGDLGLLVAFGPGFGCESLLLHWGVPSRARFPVEAPAAKACPA